MYFPANYNPYGPHATPPAGEAPTVPLAVFHAAQQAGASHLSADGLRIYREDRGSAEVAYWDDEAGRFDSWWRLPEGLPADAVRM